VVVELIDDGRGLHREKIVAKAIEKGLIESDKGMTRQRGVQPHLRTPASRRPRR
jgi:chemotaxis protein histidine kinase CheA